MQKRRLIMFSKIGSYLGKAWRESRATAGMLTGGVFFLYGICGLPINTLPLGITFASLTFLGALTHCSFAYRRMVKQEENYTIDVPSSTSLCLSKFNRIKNSAQVKNIFSGLANNREVMQKLNANGNVSEKDLREIANFFYASKTSTCQIATKKMSFGLFWGLMQFTSHFAECNQIGALADNSFNFKSFTDLSKMDAKAIFLLMLIVFAFWNSMQTINSILQTPEATEHEIIRTLMTKITKVLGSIPEDHAEEANAEQVAFQAINAANAKQPTPHAISVANAEQTTFQVSNTANAKPPASHEINGANAEQTIFQAIRVI